jgi:hypothetical protein
MCNAAWGPTLQAVEMSSQTLLQNGSTIADRLPQPRELSFQLNQLTSDDELKIQEMKQHINLNKNVFVSLYPEANTVTERLYTLLGFLKQGSTSPTSRQNVLYHTFSATIREAL